MGALPLNVNRLLLDARELDASEFLQVYPTPFFLVEPLIAESDDEWSFDTVAVSMPERAPASPATDTQVSDSSVPVMAFPVRKEGVAQANLVTIGRTKTSDIWLDSKAVSKLHAYFSRDPVSGAYTLTDAGSTNGTLVGDERLQQSQAHRLAGGEVIEIAGRFRGTFYLPEQLLGFLRGR